MADTAAERLARTMEPDGDWHLGEWRIAVRIAERAILAGWVHRDDLIAQGWTPPPDPWEAIARALAAAMWTINGEGPYVGEFTEHTVAGRLLAAVRRIPDDLARQVAEALRGES